MNFLGHIYFSNNDCDLMYNNLFGDFVKGRYLDQYSSEVQAGIYLHRNIDTYIDQHPKVLELMHQLYSELPKVTGIAIDLFFDHLLAKNWKEFHEMNLNDYLEQFYLHQPTNWQEYSPKFQFVVEKIRTKKWMNYYSEIDGLDKACKGVSSRISFENELKNAKNVFIKYEEIITTCFYTYMADAKEKFK